jgi:hypothetical protein
VTQSDFDPGTPPKDNANKPASETKHQKKQGWWEKTKNFFRTRRSKYSDREELSWDGEEPQVANLFVTLRVRYEGSLAAAIREAWFGWLFSAVGIAGAVGSGLIAFCGWETILTLDIIPNNSSTLWPKMLSTSGAVLLAMTAAGIVLKVGDRFSQRSASYLKDANETRCIEAAVRLAFMVPKADQAKTVQQLMDKMLPQLESKEDSDLDIPSIQGVIEAVKNIAVEAIHSIVEKAKPK